MPQPLKRYSIMSLALAVVCASALTACSNSRRVYDPRLPASNSLPRQVSQAPQYNTPSDDILAPSVTGSYNPSSPNSGGIVSQPLDAPAGAPQMLSANPSQTPLIASEPSQPPSLPEASNRNVADLRPATERVTPRSNTSVLGSWAAKDATGAKCKLQLSSSPALDLYKASASGCANKDLAKVTAWDQRDGEIYLYQRGGTITARLRPSGAGYDGVMTKSSAALSMTR